MTSNICTINKINKYIQLLKNDIYAIIEEDRNNQIDSDETFDKIKEIFNTYNTKSMTNFIFKKRSRNTIPQCERCNALRANGDQCTRRKQSNSKFCGTHSKGTPNGLFNKINIEDDVYEKCEIEIIEYKDIPYYIDKNKNIYLHEDILNNIKSPRKIGKFLYDKNNVITDIYFY